MGSRGFQLSSASRRRLYKTKKTIHFDGLSSGLTSGDLRFNGNYVNDAGSRLPPHIKLLIICNSFRSRLQICKSTGSLNLNLNSVALVPCVCFHYFYYTIQGAISIVYVCCTSESLVNPVVLSLSLSSTVDYFPSTTSTSTTRRCRI